METLNFNQVSPEEINQSYLALRELLLEENENSTKEFERSLKEERAEVQTRRNSCRESGLAMLSKLRVNQKEIEEWKVEQQRSNKSFLNAKLQTIKAKNKEIDLASLIYQKRSNPEVIHLTPYAVLEINKKTNNDKALWYETKIPYKGDTHKELYLEVGPGSDYDPLPILPPYYVSDTKSIQWNYLYLPKSRSNWACSTSVLLNGFWLIHAWDTCFNSKDAIMSLDISLKLRPFSSLKEVILAKKNIWFYQDDQILKVDIGLWDEQIGPISQIPGLRRPSWITVDVTAFGAVAGEETKVIFDFTTQYAKWSPNQYCGLGGIWNYDVSIHP